MTISEIAALAGVSVATISRVLNHPEVVQQETRERVLAVMEQLNYSPSWCARGLRLGKPGMIVVLVPDIENTFTQMAVAGVETVASAKLHPVVLCGTRGNSKREAEYLLRMTDRQADGVILINSLLRGEQLRALDDRGIPFVHIGRRDDGACRHFCYIDHAESVFKLMQHLSGLGHRRVAFLLNPFATILEQQVREGANLALLQAPAGASLDFYTAEDTASGGFNLVKRLLSEHSLPDVLVAGSAEQTMGIVHAAQYHGLAIPDDLAVASLADAPVCSVLNPPVTSIVQPVKRLGMMAARMLFDLLDGDDMAEGLPQEISLKSKLQIRRSCGNTKYIYESIE